ncbi:TIGR03364 family FAD-dependent oxidoreductase [Flammeovirgaceae bacterium SG7u.111]|nr:TIGR03364 family FAD-dependent oxidoreductase [Flammeovirgaceae bacterium SG7u.132]WPO36991.1 TIGR03364 family FAD-dependent oxidoreductase [Flammeovirgaceae bacterium SG7u.111]
MSRKYDVIIVGAGIVGLAHAYQAAKNKLRVLVIERNEFALGASVRNFGLVWPIGMKKGKMLDRALKSRKIWKKILKEQGIGYKKNGSLLLAYHPDELEVLKEFVDYAEDAPYEVEMLSRKEMKKRYAHVNPSNLKGGLMSRTEMTVDPREAIQGVADFLAEELNVDFLFGRTVTGINLPEVTTFDQKFTAQKVIICSGTDFETLYPGQLKQAGLTKCKLQMMRTVPIQGFELGPTLCGGLTFRHYKAFEKCPSVKKLRKRLDKEWPEQKKYGIHVMLAQNLQGELVIGDSHKNGSEHFPFNEEVIDRAILTYLETFYHTYGLKIAQRWEGIYPKLPNGKTELILQPEPNVLLVNGLGGAGMTLSFGLAEEVVKEFVL